MANFFIAIALCHASSIDINARDSNGDTPLHIACKCKNSELARILRSHSKIDLKVINNEGKTPEQYMAFRKEVKIKFSEYEPRKRKRKN